MHRKQWNLMLGYIALVSLVLAGITAILGMAGYTIPPVWFLIVLFGGIAVPNAFYRGVD